MTFENDLVNFGVRVHVNDLYYDRFEVFFKKRQDLGLKYFVRDKYPSPHAAVLSICFESSTIMQALPFCEIFLFSGISRFVEISRFVGISHFVEIFCLGEISRFTLISVFTTIFHSCELIPFCKNALLVTSYSSLFKMFLQSFTVLSGFPIFCKSFLDAMQHRGSGNSNIT